MPHSHHISTNNLSFTLHLYKAISQQHPCICGIGWFVVHIIWVWYWLKSSIGLQYNQSPRRMENFIADFPPVTRLLMLHQLLGLAIEYGGYFSRYDLYFNFDKIFLEGETSITQVWRLLTSLFFLKKTGIFLFFEVLFTYHMLKNLQRGFNRGSIDFLYLMVVISSVLYGLAWALSISYLGLIFKYVIYYIYGRTNYDHILQINLIPIRAPFLIWLLFLIDWVTDTPELKNLVVGILLGHTLFFLIKVYPNLYFSKKMKPLDTPDFFIDLVSPFFKEEDRVQRPAEELWG